MAAEQFLTGSRRHRRPQHPFLRFCLGCMLFQSHADGQPAADGRRADYCLRSLQPRGQQHRAAVADTRREGTGDHHLQAEHAPTDLYRAKLCADGAGRIFVHDERHGQQVVRRGKRLRRGVPRIAARPLHLYPARKTEKSGLGKRTRNATGNHHQATLLAHLVGMARIRTAGIGPRMVSAAQL